MHVDLQGQTAVVTGGAMGIGRAIAESLAANGAAVAIVDLAAGEAEATAESLRAAGRQAAAFAGDVADARRMTEIAGQVAEQFGPPSILVNNAGINTLHDRKPIHEYPAADWDRILRVDLTGVFTTSQAFVPHMLGRERRSGVSPLSGNSGETPLVLDRGRIVNIASIAGLVPLRLQSAFVAAKAGVVNLSKSMALELGPLGILTNCVAPGSTLTQGTRALFYGESGAYSEKAASLLSHVPVGRPGSPEEIAHAVLFLVAPEASYINGAVLAVDGGWTAGFTRDW